MEFLPRMIHHQDEPTADPTSIPQHFVAQLARDNGTIVVQCGEGSDELFHGYKGYADHRRYVVPFQRVPQPLRRGLGTFAARATRRLGQRHPPWRGPVRRRPQLHCRTGAARCASEARSRTRSCGISRERATSYATVERHWDDAERLAPGVDLFQRMTYLELKQRLPELLLMRLDKITMASSVEGREPFLDHHLVEFALALPPEMKYRDGVGKYVLKRAMRGLLPDEVLSRPKQGFGTPMEEWMRGDFGVRAQQAIRRSSLAERGLLDYRADRSSCSRLTGPGGAIGTSISGTSTASARGTTAGSPVSRRSNGRRR